MRERYGTKERARGGRGGKGKSERPEDNGIESEEEDGELEFVL